MTAYDDAKRLMVSKEPLVSREEVNRIFAELVAEIDRLRFEPRDEWTIEEYDRLTHG